MLTCRQGEDAGLSKDELMLKADELGVSKDPMGGTGGWCAELHRGRVRGYSAHGHRLVI